MSTEKKSLVNGRFANLLRKLGIYPEDFTAKGLLTVVGIFMVGLGVLGIANSILSQFTLPLAEAFGVERSVISLHSTFSKISGALAALIFGLVYKKLTLKGTVLMSGACLVVQFLLIAIAQSPLMVYIACTIGGFGTQFGGGALIMVAIKPWFPRNVGVFAAFCGMASGFGGQFFSTPLTKTITENGYQAGAMRIALFIAIFTVVATILSFMSPNDPLRKRSKEEEAALKAAKDAEALKKANTGIPALGYKDFLKCPATWLLMLTMFLAAGTNQPFVSAWPAMADWKGFEDAAMVGAAATAAYSGLLVWAKFIMGYMKDRNWTYWAILFAWGTNIVSVLGVLFCKDPGAFKFFCTINAFAGTSTGLFIGLCVVQSFGKYYSAVAQGLSGFSFNIGRAIGAPLIHLAYDKTGSYNITLIYLLVIGIAIMACLLLAVKFGNRAEKALDKKYGLGEYAVAATEKE